MITSRNIFKNFFSCVSRIYSSSYILPVKKRYSLRSENNLNMVTELSSPSEFPFQNKCVMLV